MIKTILAPVDGSAHASKAVVLAADIADKYDARLVLLHVLLAEEPPESLLRMVQNEHIVEPEPTALVAEPNVPAGIASSLQRSRHDRWSSTAAERLGDWILQSGASSAKRQGAAKVSVHKRDGDVAPEIVRCAVEEDADLIVMGSRGLGYLEELLMGSVSHKVAQLAPCSCVTVK